MVRLLWGKIPAVVLAILLAGCAVLSPPSRDYSPSPPPVPAEERPVVTEQKPLPRMGYTIQAGAFSNAENAAKLAQYLTDQNLDAYYFQYSKGLYKVRFGNFATEEEATREAVILKAMGTIDAFYIVRPSDYSAARETTHGKPYVRSQIVETARAFVGVPYRWGGTTIRQGFDCSGLAMAVFKLNGLNLPRTSRQQFHSGITVSRDKLKRGDLVFFDTAGRGDVSHVGIYVGDNKFIHAPRTGKTVRVSSLSSRYYNKRYYGARSYL
jgi:cell wall-associated NlpC family hydrolase